LEAERLAADKAEADRQAKLKAEVEAKELAERKATEAKAKAELEAKEREEARLEEQARLEAARPDVEKIREFAAGVRSIALPVVKTAAAKDAVIDIRSRLEALAVFCETYKVK